jgi:hypothetical protein
VGSWLPPSRSVSVSTLSRDEIIQSLRPGDWLMVLYVTGIREKWQKELASSISEFWKNATLNLFNALRIDFKLSGCQATIF